MLFISPVENLCKYEYNMKYPFIRNVQLQKMQNLEKQLKMENRINIEMIENNGAEAAGRDYGYDYVFQRLDS